MNEKDLRESAESYNRLEDEVIHPDEGSGEGERGDTDVENGD